MNEVDEGRGNSLPTISLIRRNSESYPTPLLMMSIIHPYFDGLHFHLIMYRGKVRDSIENWAIPSRHDLAYIADQLDQGIHPLIFNLPELKADFG